MNKMYIDSILDGTIFFSNPPNGMVIFPKTFSTTGLHCKNRNLVHLGNSVTIIPFILDTKTLFKFTSFKTFEIMSSKRKAISELQQPSAKRHKGEAQNESKCIKLNILMHPSELSNLENIGISKESHWIFEKLTVENGEKFTLVFNKKNESAMKEKFAHNWQN